MTDNAQSHGSIDVLDFPGADDLIAAGRVEPPSAQVVEAARAQVSAGPVVVPLQAPRWKQSRSRRLLVAAAAVAAIAAGAVAYPVIGVGESKPPASASAAEFLNRVAATAAGASQTDAPYWKVHVEVDNEDDGQRQSTSWFDREGHLWFRNSDGSIEKPGPGGKLKAWPVGDEFLTWKRLESLPTDPDALERRLGDDVFGKVSILLQDAPLAPEVRAALFKIMARTEGVKLIGQVEDTKGRKGTAVEFTRRPGGMKDPATGRRTTFPPRTTRLVIDSESGKLLESYDTAKGMPDSRATYLEVGPVDKID
ncbi:CU044_5270 family protein [Streptomyces sp. NBC_01717]|uniref:CU044_5270 family protein n=1 Tax=Streptomyces sp. NBC_01717 TaxID=2975918 RepID=UPI002E349DFF|nr:CU044_5270 family protein [Streptomyces sp. NBC_01717]